MSSDRPSAKQRAFQDGLWGYELDSYWRHMGEVEYAAYQKGLKICDRFGHAAESNKWGADYGE